MKISHALRCHCVVVVVVAGVFFGLCAQPLPTAPNEDTGRGIRLWMRSIWTFVCCARALPLLRSHTHNQRPTGRESPGAPLVWLHR